MLKLVTSIFIALYRRKATIEVANFNILKG